MKRTRQRLPPVVIDQRQTAGSGQLCFGAVAPDPLTDLNPGAGDREVEATLQRPRHIPDDQVRQLTLDLHPGRSGRADQVNTGRQPGKGPDRTIDGGQPVAALDPVQRRSSYPSDPAIPDHPQPSPARRFPPAPGAQSASDRPASVKSGPVPTGAWSCRHAGKKIPLRSTVKTAHPRNPSVPPASGLPAMTAIRDARHPDGFAKPAASLGPFRRSTIPGRTLPG